MSSRSDLISDGLAVLALVVAALALRLPNLDVYTVSLPEGIRVEQLKLMSAGYQACQEVFCNQGPLALQVMHPTFVLFGETLAAARSSAIIGSTVGLIGLYWIGRQLFDRPTALMAGLILALSPSYLKLSRLALPETVALAPAILAIGAAARYSQTMGRGWLVTAGLLYGFSLLIKPVAAPAIIPIAALCLVKGLRGQTARQHRDPPGAHTHRMGDVLVAAGACAGIVLIGCLLVGLPAIWDQVVFRLQSRAAEGRAIDWNWGIIYDELKHEQPGLFALAVAGALSMGRTHGAALVVIGSWTAASLLLLLIHTPLRDKHVVVLLPAIALLAGRAIGTLLCWAVSLMHGPRLRPSLAVATASLGAALYLGTFPRLAALDASLVNASEMLERDPARLWYADASAALAASTAPGSFVVTDFPYIAFGANRLVPPQLVESSLTRIRAGSLTDDIAIAEASQFSPEAVLLWWDRLARLPGFKRWVDRHYQVVRVYAADEEAVTSLYLPLASELGATRPALAASASIPSGARFGTGLVMDSWGLDSAVAAPGESRSLTVLWQASDRLRPDLHAVLTLRNEEDLVWTSQRLPLLGNGDGLRGWPPGRWVVWSGLVYFPTRVAPGPYVLSLRVIEGGSGDLLPVHRPPSRPTFPADDPKGLDLALVDVTGPAVSRKRPL